MFRKGKSPLSIIRSKSFVDRPVNQLVQIQPSKVEVNKELTADIKKPSIKKPKRLIDIENEEYSIESFYYHWQNNKATIENELNDQFCV